jgi:PAS domain S-box-containing protein
MVDKANQEESYQQQIEALNHQIAHLQQELAAANHSLFQSRIANILVSRIFALIPSETPLREVGARFLHIVADTMNINRAILFKDREDGRLQVQHTLGSTPEEMSLSLPHNNQTPGLILADADTPNDPFLITLKQTIGAEALLWAYDPYSTCALLAARTTETESSQQPFTPEEGHTFIVAAQAYADVLNSKWTQQALSDQLATQELAVRISSSFINLPVEHVDGSIETALRLIAQFAGAEHAYFGAKLSSPDEEPFVYEWTAPGVRPLGAQVEGIHLEYVLTRFRGSGPFANALHLASPDHLQQDPPAAREAIQRMGIASGLGIPIMVDDAFFGFLGVFSHTEAVDWSPKVITLLQLASEIFISALKHKEAAQALAASEANYRRLVEGVNNIIVRLDPKGNVIFMNQFAEHFFGYTTTELKGRNMVGLIAPEVDSEGRDMQALIEGIAQNPAAYAYNENENMRRSGERVWVGWTNRSVFDAEGRAVEVLCIGTDITERRKARQELHRSLTQTVLLNRVIAAVTSTLDPMSVLEIVCREVAHALNVPQAGFALMDPSGESLTVVADYRAAKRPSAIGEVIPIEGNELTQWVLVNRRPIAIEDITSDPRAAVSRDLFSRHDIASILIVPLIVQDEVVGTLGLDAIERRQFTLDEVELVQNVAAAAAQAWENSQLHAAVQRESGTLAQRVAERTAELQAANEQLAHAVRLKDEFLANMSHELRTPLNAVLGLSEALREEVYGPLTDRQHRSLASIESSGRHLLDLINDILDISRIEADRMELDAHPVRVSTLCQSCMDMIKPGADKGKIHISLQIEDDLPTLTADERRLKQILVNLLTNAVKFTPEEGDVGLTVALDRQHHWMTFTVWDTGIGISAENRERIFEPFVQLDASLSRHYGGTGLGLALAHRLARLHGGSIEVESEPGQGSRFTLIIPWRGQASHQ